MSHCTGEWRRLSDNLLIQIADVASVFNMSRTLYERSYPALNVETELVWVVSHSKFQLRRRVQTRNWEIANIRTIPWCLAAAEFGKYEKFKMRNSECGERTLIAKFRLTLFT